MLSTNYRIKMECICEKISNGQFVELSDMIWAEKLAKSNRSAATMLRQARRKSENPDMKEGDMDDFLNKLDIGGFGHERHGKARFETVDEIVEWFRRDSNDDWRTRD